jgi:hypothetical protein
MSDDGFREIQLSGKQLVFLFMATTVVSVAIFLCGVLVGRGVGARQASGSTPIADSIGRGGQVSGDELPDWTQPIDEANTEIADELYAEPSLEDEHTAAVVPSEQVLPLEPFTVQVAALTGRASAEVIRDKLSDKGYPAYLLDPPPGVPGEMFRVRVGRYQDRADAEHVRRRLEQEEKFKPWITR